MTEPKRRPGRPSKPKEERKRNNLTLRIRDETREALEQAAQTNQRSLSEEAEARIEGFVSINLGHFLELAYGRPLAGLLMAIGETMKAAGEMAGFSATFTLEGSRAWTGVPYAYDQAANGAAAVIEAFRPEGEPVPPKALFAADAVVATNLGRGCANTILEEAASGLSRTLTDRARAETLHRLLADLADRVKAFDLLSEGES